MKKLLLELETFNMLTYVDDSLQVPETTIDLKITITSFNLINFKCKSCTCIKHLIY